MTALELILSPLLWWYMRDKHGELFSQVLDCRWLKAGLHHDMVDPRKKHAFTYDDNLYLLPGSILPNFWLPRFTINLPYCLLYISHYFSSENFVSNQTIFICWYFFSILVTVLFENIWTLLGETTACLLSKQTVNYQWRIQRDLNNFLQIKVAVIT